MLLDGIQMVTHVTKHALSTGSGSNCIVLGRHALIAVSRLNHFLPPCLDSENASRFDLNVFPTIGAKSMV